MNCTEIIMKHGIKVDPHPGAVYVKHKGREVSCRYDAAGGDKVRALELALCALCQLCGIDDGVNAGLPARGMTSIRYGRPEPLNHIRQLAAQMAAKEMQA